MEYLFIYGLQFMSIIEGVLVISIMGFICFTVAYIIMGFMTQFQYEEYDGGSYYDISETSGKMGSKIFKKGLIITGVMSLILAFIPTKQTMLLIGGTYLGKKAVNKVATSDKIEKINTIIDLQLDKYIKELKGNDN